MTDDPWWLVSARLFAVLGMSWGAWQGWKRKRAGKPETPVEPEAVVEKSDAAER